MSFNAAASLSPCRIRSRPVASSATTDLALTAERHDFPNTTRGRALPPVIRRAKVALTHFWCSQYPSPAGKPLVMLRNAGTLPSKLHVPRPKKACDLEHPALSIPLYPPAPSTFHQKCVRAQK